MTKGSLKEIDRSNYFDVLIDFPNQVRNACKIGENLKLKNSQPFDNVIICGMGGSSISGQFLQNYSKFTRGADHLNFHINQDYNIPKFIDNKYFGVVSSYSGNTEETISAYNELKERTNQIFCSTSGGKLLESAKENEFSFAELPSGFQPRAAIAYSFFPVLYSMMLSGNFKTDATQITSYAINELIDKIDNQSKLESKENNESTFMIAEKLANKTPVIFTSQRFKALNTRVQNQFQENSKIHAFGNILPEMNHNQINSLDDPLIKKYNYVYIIIKDNEDNDRTSKRFDFLIDLLKSKDLDYIVIEPQSKSLLSKYFELIYQFDWITYWLALINGVDPTEIKIITELKKYLSK